MFGSWAQGDSDDYSDVDGLAAAPSSIEASGLAHAVLELNMANDDLLKAISPSGARGRGTAQVADPL